MKAPMAVASTYQKPHKLSSKLSLFFQNVFYCCDKFFSKLILELGNITFWSLLGRRMKHKWFIHSTNIYIFIEGLLCARNQSKYLVLPVNTKDKHFSHYQQPTRYFFFWLCQSPSLVNVTHTHTHTLIYHILCDYCKKIFFLTKKKL